MSIIQMFDYSISALTVVCYLLSVIMTVKYGNESWKGYCIMTHKVMAQSFFSKTWIAAVNIIALASLFSALFYFKVYAFVVVNVILLLVTIVVSVIGEEVIDRESNHAEDQ
jgi:hypothetical protein